MQEVNGAQHGCLTRQSIPGIKITSRSGTVIFHTLLWTGTEKFSQWLTRYDEIMRTRAVRDDVLSPLFHDQNRGISTHDIHRIQRASKIKDSVSCTVCLDPVIWLLYAYVSVGMSPPANKHNGQINVCWWSANLIVAW